MALPIIQSTQATPGAGTPGAGRNDLVLAEAVNLSDTEAANSGASYIWTFDDLPIGSSAAFTGPLTATPSFTPDVEGSYRVKCLVNGVSYDTEILAVPLPATGSRIPSFNEELEYDESGNAKGWHEAQDQFMRAVDAQLGTASTDELAKVSATDTTPAVLEDKIIAGANITVNKINSPGNEQLQIVGAVAAGHTHTEANITDLTHLDPNAIHDNVAGEINALTAKATPVAADVIVIEDSQNFFTKKKATLTDLLGGGAGPIAAAQGDYVTALLGADYTTALVLPQRVPFDTIGSQRGDLNVDLVTNIGRVTGLKAGRTYHLYGSVVTSTTASYFQYRWYDLTEGEYVGNDAYALSNNRTATVSDTPGATHLFTPVTDTEVELRIHTTSDVNYDINGDNFTQIIVHEIGAVQADVVGGLEFMDIIEVTADQTSVSFGAAGDGAFQRALDGDVDHEYEVSWYLPISATSVTLRPNAIDPAVDGTFDGSTSLGGQSVVNANQAFWQINAQSGSHIEAGKLTVQAETGGTRSFTSLSALHNGTVRYSNIATGRWDNTVINLTSLQFFAAAASGIKIGARFVLWRKTRTNLRADSASTYERNVEAVVAQGNAAEVEYTTGHATYQGSAIGVSVSLNDTVTAGTITVNVKVAGVTKLTAVLDTTNTTFARDLETIGVAKVASGDEIVVGIATSGLTTTGGLSPGITVNTTLVNEALLAAAPDFLNTANVYTKAQAVSPGNLVSVANSVAIDGSISNLYFLQVDENTTVQNPANVVSGQIINIAVNQVAAFTAAWGTAWLFPGGDPVLSVTAGADCLVSGVVLLTDGAGFIGLGNALSILANISQDHKK